MGSSCGCLLLVSERARHGLGEAEVEQLDDAVAAEADVGRLQVAVDDAVTVGRFEPRFRMTPVARPW
jgi:hypothetical protein